MGARQSLCVVGSLQRLDQLLGEIRACRICVDSPRGEPLPHVPRPVLQASSVARLGVFGQAPGMKVHLSGRPFTDPSGVRLRSWMGIDEVDFYDPEKVAVVPMGFCFPGYDAKGGDRPPRKECAASWRSRLMPLLPKLELVLLVGRYAQVWHLEGAKRENLTEMVRRWREVLDLNHSPQFMPLPHPSWRNTAWLKRNPWFETELLPDLQARVRTLLV